ncbi:MAG TPA: peptide ABC transporter substrate-binding protein, partial [Ktedonobacteraceae bacterium]|nr:peptide ABC transporter substrate-binding protein [Ktedonobacteraceae bacterium]
AALDPATVTDTNTNLILSMVYSGLVRLDSNLLVVPDQANWRVSSDNKTYTFNLKPGIAFADGTPVTAQTYVYSLTRALLPDVQSTNASFYEQYILGANDVAHGKTKTLVGVKALNSSTLQITLTRSIPYFLQVLTNSVFFPVNKQLVDRYGQNKWADHVVGNGIGTGPFMIQSWQHSVKMVLVPNPHYYGARTKLTQVNMIFVNDQGTAFTTYRAGQYDFAWNLTMADQVPAKNLVGFTRVPQLETDVLFFNVNMPPFDNPIIRQAFANAIDKQSLAHTVLNDSVVPAPTIIPPGMPGYQPNYQGIPFNAALAKTLFQSVYPDPTTVPPITFSYPSSGLPTQEVTAIQNMWLNTLGITVTVHAVEPNAYNDELLKHQIQLGFYQWNADYNDPYDVLAQYLLSTASNNYGGWNNSSFDQLIKLTDRTSGDVRLALFHQAEQVAIQDVGWLPIDHETLSAVIPPWVHGISLNANGLFFGDWSDVYLLQH